MPEPIAGDSEMAPSQDLAAALEPVLRAACKDRLESIGWFRTDWQRGGAATGGSVWKDVADRSSDVVVKLPVPPRELRWLSRLGIEGDPHVPRFYAGGEELGGYDFAWVVMERLPHGPLLLEWSPECVPPIADAAAAFASLASRHPVDPPPAEPDWSARLAASRGKVRELRLANSKAWTALIRAVATRLETLLERWAARRPLEWIHGDLHPGNAMTRESDRPASEVCLVDFAEVRVGHWVEDAVYLERLHWARPERIAGHPPVRAIAAARKARGLDNGSDHAVFAAIRRLLMAATAPAFARTEGSPAYFEACLTRANESLKALK
ncbi:MAG: aminoglycoside phosphotransferase family protein [Phycisphaerales bacterium]|jgi:Ser/Thr protein kinase RdoA (MazF antagonist)